MQMDIWKCRSGHIHLSTEQGSFVFNSFEEFADFTGICQNYVGFVRRKALDIPEAFHTAFEPED